MKLRHWLTVGASSFLGGGFAWIEAHAVAVPTTAHAWAAVGCGFAFGGIVALGHLFQDKPGAPS